MSSERKNVMTLPPWAEAAFGPLGTELYLSVKSDPEMAYEGTLVEAAFQSATEGWLILEYPDTEGADPADPNTTILRCAVAISDISSVVHTPDEPMLDALIAHPEATTDEEQAPAEPAPAAAEPDPEGWEEAQAAALPIHLGKRIRIHNPTTGDTTEGELISVAPNPSSHGGQRVVVGMDGGASHTFMLADDTGVRVQ